MGEQVTFLFFIIILAAAWKRHTASFTKKKIQPYAYVNCQVFKKHTHLCAEEYTCEIQINDLLPLWCLHSHQQPIPSNSWNHSRSVSGQSLKLVSYKKKRTSSFNNLHCLSIYQPFPMHQLPVDMKKKIRKVHHNQHMTLNKISRWNICSQL